MGKEAGYQTLALLTSHNFDFMMNEKINIPDYYANNLEELIPLIRSCVDK